MPPRRDVAPATAPRSAPVRRQPQGRDSEKLDLHAITALLRRRLPIIAAATLVCLAIGATYAFTAQPRYTAVAGLLLDSIDGGLSDLNPTNARAAEDAVAIETQMQIIRSQRVALSVVDELGLVDHPLFIPDQPDAITALVKGLRDLLRDGADALAPADPSVAAASGADGASVLSPREEAATTLRGNLSVRRVGASRAVEVAYSGTHPQLAAEIANALTRAYVEDRVRARFEATDNAGDWLRVRIADLQEQFAETAQRVQQFRADNNIVDAGGGRGLVDEQALSEVNQRLVEATTLAAEARARFSEVERALARDDLDADLIDAGESDLITSLRQRYVESANRLAELELRLAPDQPALAAARRELARVAEAIRNELRRLAERLRSNAEIAAEREATLRAELNRLIERANVTGTAQVRLQQLESEAEVLQAAYESFLQRYTDVIQRQSAPFLEARTISPALTPIGPSQPQRALVLALSAIFGAGLGLAGALLLEGFDRTVRLPRDLERIGLASLGVTPFVAPVGKAFRGRSAHAAPAAAAAELGYAAVAPDSPFAIGLRRAKTELAATLGNARGGAVIGVTSLGEGEGKTTIASNLGQLFALSGRRALLVDADPARASLSAVVGALEEGALGPSHKLSVMRADALSDRLRDPSDNAPRAGAAGADLVSPERLRAFLGEAREMFEVTILDLPAIDASPDAAAVGPHLDALVVVAEWSGTPADRLERAVETLRRHGAPVVGGILNKARGALVAAQAPRRAPRPVAAGGAA